MKSGVHNTQDQDISHPSLMSGAQGGICIEGLLCTMGNVHKPHTYIHSVYRYNSFPPELGRTLVKGKLIAKHNP